MNKNVNILNLLMNYVNDEDAECLAVEYCLENGLENKATFSRAMRNLSEINNTLYEKVKNKNALYKPVSNMDIDFSPLLGKYVPRTYLIDWFVKNYDHKYKNLTCRDLIDYALKAGVNVGKEYY